MFKNRQAIAYIKAHQPSTLYNRQFKDWEPDPNGEPNSFISRGLHMGVRKGSSSWLGWEVVELDAYDEFRTILERGFQSQGEAEAWAENQPQIEIPYAPE